MITPKKKQLRKVLITLTDEPRNRVKVVVQFIGGVHLKQRATPAQSLSIGILEYVAKSHAQRRGNARAMPSQEND